jgi:hypothetical protein
MPQSDFTQVTVTLKPAAAPRPSFGVSMLLESLTEAQYLAIGTDRTALLTSETWAADLAALGITDGEQAYENVQAHFSGARSPDKAYLGKRGKDRAQVKTITIPASPADGVYAVVVNGLTYSFAASSSTQADVRTGLLAAIGTPAWGTATAGGAGEILLTAGTAGVGLTTVLSSPSSSMTIATTTTAFVAAVAQVWTIDINTAALGPYVLTVQTSTGQKTYTHVATSGATLQTIRDAIKALYDADPSDLFGATMTAVSTDQGTLTASLAGRPGTVTLTSPAADATATVTTANYGIIDDLDAAKADQPEWYMALPGTRVAAELLLCDTWVAGIGIYERYMWLGQTSDAAVLTSGASVAATLKARATLRTQLCYHPIDAEGFAAAWAGDVLTDRAGQVSWVARPLTGLTGSVLTPSQAANLRANEVSYLERFAARSQNIANGGYSMGGRPIDIMRAIDTFASNCEIALMDLLVSSRILPYTDAGVELARGVLLQEFSNAVSQGYAVEGSLVLNKPKISDALTADRVRGIMPTFVGSATFQAGAYKVIANFEVEQ